MSKQEQVLVIEPENELKFEGKPTVKHGCSVRNRAAIRWVIGLNDSKQCPVFSDTPTKWDSFEHLSFIKDISFDSTEILTINVMSSISILLRSQVLDFLAVLTATIDIGVIQSLPSVIITWNCCSYIIYLHFDLKKRLFELVTLCCYPNPLLNLSFTLLAMICLYANRLHCCGILPTPNVLCIALFWSLFNLKWLL